MKETIGNFFIAVGLVIGSWFGVTAEPTLGANQKISELTALNSVDGLDLFPIVDTSAGQTKSLSWNVATGSIKTILDSVYSPIFSTSPGLASLLSDETGSSGGFVRAGSPTITSPNISSPVITSLSSLSVGSDATGDIYYRNSGGNFTRLPIGATNEFLRVSGGIPDWDNTALLTNPQTASSTFTATTSYTWDNVNSRALIVNGLAYAWPTSRGLASTTLVEDGTGGLSWASPHFCYTSTYSTTTTNGGSEQKVFNHKLGIPPTSFEASSVSTEATVNSGQSMSNGYAAMASSTIVSQTHTAFGRFAATLNIGVTNSVTKAIGAYGDVGGGFAEVLGGTVVWNSATSTVVNFVSDSGGGQAATVNVSVKICR